MEKVFILGNPRSGTSLFRLILNSHSRIAATPECGFLHWWYSKYKDWNDESILKGRLTNFIEDLKTSKKIEEWSLDFEKLKNEIIKTKPENYARLGELVYLSYARQKEKDPKIIADKNNYYINHLNDLKEIWQDAKFIFIIRDGRDVACSYINLDKLKTDSPYKPKLSTEITKIAREWLDNNYQVINFLKNLPTGSGFTIRYEDLILNTENILSKVCSFLSIEFEKKMLQYYINNAANKDEPDSTIDWKRKTLEKPDESNIGKYRKELNKEEINEFNKVAKEMLKEFNYEI